MSWLKPQPILAAGEGGCSLREDGRGSCDAGHLITFLLLYRRDGGKGRLWHRSPEKADCGIGVRRMTRAHELWHCCSPLLLPGTWYPEYLPLLISSHCPQEHSDSTVMKTSTCTGRSQWAWLVAKGKWGLWAERPGHAAVALSSLLKTKVQSGETSWAAPTPRPGPLPQPSCCSRMRLDVLPEPGTMWEGDWEGTRNGDGRKSSFH